MENTVVKIACKEAFECGIEDVKGNCYEHELTDSFFTLITALRVDCKMNLPYLTHDDDVIYEISQMAWQYADEVGGICSTYEVVKAIGNYKFKKDCLGFLKGEKMVDKRTKGYKKLHKIGDCLDTFRNMGVLLACEDEEAIERDYKGIREALSH